MGILIHPMNIENLYLALQCDGWRYTPWQNNFGQSFGLIKDWAANVEIHVRAYPEGQVDAHIEVGRDYLEHLNWPSVDASGYVVDILSREGIPYQVNGLANRPQYYALPGRLTAWRPLVGIAAIFLGLIGLSRLEKA